jgi:competence protein ComEA
MPELPSPGRGQPHEADDVRGLDELDGLDERGALDALVRPAPPRSLRDRAADLADATGTTPVRIAAGAVALAVAVVAGLWLTRPAAPPPEVALPFASTGPSAPSTSTTSGGSSTTEATEVVVYVAGQVQRPGVLHLRSGARVVDAIDGAGGLAASADGARLNLAAPLQDGQRVYVPAVGEAPPPLVEPSGGGTGATTGDAGAGTGGAPTPGAPVDLNTATEADLDALPGVGPATAQAIVQHRDEVGGYTSVDQLLDVPGIGPAKLERIRPLVRV